MGLLARCFVIVALVISFIVGAAGDEQNNSTTSKVGARYSQTMDDFLDDVQERTFHYFWDLADPTTGLIPDRAPSITFSSTAAHGFGLTSYLVGVQRGYITRTQAGARVLQSLKVLWSLPQGPEVSGVAGYKGFFYHFLHMNTGLRFLSVELSTIDTALLMAGVLTCYSYFDNEEDSTELEIRKVAEDLYLRVEWDWFLVRNTNLLSMGWHPESQKFLDALWSGYNEGMILYILGLGSSSHPLPAESWNAWTKTYVWAKHMGYEHLNFGPLFGHQYSHMYIDFRGIKDSYMRSQGIDYFENSRRATLAQREYCRNNTYGFRDYNESIWGLTACDGPNQIVKQVNGRTVHFATYRARGTAVNYAVDDGTISPTAAGGSVPFASEECITALMTMYQKYGTLLYGQYGFKDAFNPTYRFGASGVHGWFDPDYIGIDQGPIILHIPAPSPSSLD